MRPTHPSGRASARGREMDNGDMFDALLILVLGALVAWSGGWP